jgi:hypothetical protein
MTESNEGFVDRDAGVRHDTATGLINAYVARFSRKVSEATGGQVSFDPLDSDGYTSVTRGSATIGINVIEAQGVLLFLSRIMKVPSENQAAFYRHLLELNYLATSDGAFAVERETDTVCLRALRSVAGLDYEEFEDMLHTVATVADEWDDKLVEEYA